MLSFEVSVYKATRHSSNHIYIYIYMYTTNTPNSTLEGAPFKQHEPRLGGPPRDGDRHAWWSGLLQQNQPQPPRLDGSRWERSQPPPAENGELGGGFYSWWLPAIRFLGCLVF